MLFIEQSIYFSHSQFYFQSVSEKVIYKKKPGIEIQGKRIEEISARFWVLMTLFQCFGQVKSRSNQPRN